MKTKQSLVLDDFFDSYKATIINAGEILWMPGQTPGGVVYLESGVFEQYDVSKTGDKVIVNIFKERSFFPMSWALNNTPNGFFYGAVTECIIREAPAKEVLRLIRNNPDILFDLLSRVYKGTDALLRRAVLTTHGTAAERILFELYIEAQRFTNISPEGAATVSLKQTELSARTGLARETISRELQKIEQSGLIIRADHSLRFSVKDIKKKLEIT